MDQPFEVDVHQARAMLDAGALLLDVREPAELGVCRIAGSMAIPMREIPARLGELPADRPILVLCHHGGRSARVSLFLRQHGLARVTNVAGGIDAWAERIDAALARY